ncbi:(d)CMP kinase [Weissella sagaensis]|uniref:Cytidylate kinase n=1 Tax=Weissella sagaensis TaxID=2559928 RepID=A0ABW1RTV0_9LACO|nr:(d)CMP kinase [Weissella sagaensis]KAA8434153.1 (d)CMP kinase [Weissella paramesenteroides]KAA8438836.1 (d)CMP kinase [Weissella paramesenteroides]MBU7567856.1 (d)CMP kinase [Weissella hellenica]QDJ58726.1 (d)CMP kinase [Weissella hellenica]
MNPIQIAIDGPASAGKSTIAKILATDLNFVYVDTGAMYRVVTLAAMRKNIVLQDEAAVAAVLPNINISFKPGNPVQRVFLNDEEVTAEIRSVDVTANVSVVSAYAAVRQAMTDLQRDIAAGGGVVMDGRDIGTTVLPNAAVKIFLIASVHERAVRRFKENQAKGMDTTLEDLEAAIEKRDYLDSHREISPLKKATDAIELDTTGLSIAEVVDSVKRIIATK